MNMPTPSRCDPTAAFALTGRRVLVAGAGGGIGQATVRLCASLGAEIIAVDLRPPTINVLPPGASVTTIACDVSIISDVEKLAQQTGAVDGLVDLAAVCPFGDWTQPDWNDELLHVLAVNVGGPLNLMRAFFPAMCERGSDRVVLTGSLAGRAGGLRAAPHYAASKGGVHALVRWFAQRGITHNVLVNEHRPRHHRHANDRRRGLRSQGLSAGSLYAARRNRGRHRVPAVAGIELRRGCYS